MSGMASRRMAELAAACACIALVGGCGGGDGDDKSGDQGSAGKDTPSAGDGAAMDAVKVNIASFKYVPESVKVKAGGTVTWTNQDKAPHTAETEEDTAGGFNTDRLDLGKSKKVTLDEPGKYSYFCIFHRFMSGTIEVVE